MADRLPGVRVTQITQDAATTPPEVDLAACVAGVRYRVYAEFEPTGGNTIPVDPGAVLDLTSMKLGIKDGLIFQTEAAPTVQPTTGSPDVLLGFDALPGDVIRVVGASLPDISYTVLSSKGGITTLTEAIKTSAAVSKFELYRYSAATTWLSTSKFTFDANGTFITVGVKRHPVSPGRLVVSGVARRCDNPGLYVISSATDLVILGETHPLNRIRAAAEAALLASGGRGPVFAYITKDESELSFSEARQAFATKIESYFIVNGTMDAKVAADSLAYISGDAQVFKTCFASVELPLFKEIVRGRKA